MENELKFGDWVNVGSKLKRHISHEIIYRDRYNKVGPIREGRYKSWRNTKTEQKKVLFLGKRTLSNGFTPYDQDCGYEYKIDSTIKAALVCEGPRKKPFYVLLEEIIKC